MYMSKPCLVINGGIAALVAGSSHQEGEGHVSGCCACEHNWVVSAIAVLLTAATLRHTALE